MTPEPEKLFALMSHNETKLGHEFALIGQRLTWLSISESFLFGGFASSVATVSSSAHPMSAPLTTLLMLLPVLGLLLALSVGIGIRAAIVVTRELQVVRGRLEAQAITQYGDAWVLRLGDPRDRGRLHWTLLAGDLPAQAVPLLMSVAWIVLIVVVAQHGFGGQ